MENKLSRRSFLIGAGTVGAGLAAAGLAGCAPQEASEEKPTEASVASTTEAGATPAFLKAPEQIKDSDIVDTVEADVVVVGLGLAGVSATRSATEEGLKVFALERCGEPSARSSQFSAFNSDKAREMGVNDVDTNELVNELMIQTGHRADFRVLKNWADNCGESFEWYASAYEGLLWQTPGEKYDMDTQVFVANGNQYEPYQYPRDHEHVVTGTLSFRAPDRGGHKPIMLANLEKAVKDGAETRFDARAVQLIKEGDTVAGVIFEDLTDGSYHKAMASKGVVLATGGYVRNDEMLAYYIPWIYNQQEKFTFTYMHTDINGDFTDQGDGIKMGHWVGGHIEEGPHCAMAHGDLGKLGVDAFLQLNAHGERYINEDLTNDHFGSALVRQPESRIYQIFDANWAEQLPAMQGGLGSKQKATEEDIATIDEWTSAKGNTIEELVAQLGVDEATQKTMIAEIERYNELCNKGVDEDFGKAPERMFALENAPFYAIDYVVGEPGLSGESQDALRCLVTMSGLSTNKYAEVLDENFETVPGLYAIGNTQGGRFLGDYPATIAGASHSIAMTYGYLVGQYIAAK